MHDRLIAGHSALQTLHMEKIDRLPFICNHHPHILKAINGFLAFNGFEKIPQLGENIDNFSRLSTSSIESNDQPELSSMLAPCKICPFIENKDKLSTPNAKRSVFITDRFIDVIHRSKNNVESGILGTPRTYKGGGEMPPLPSPPIRFF